MNTNRLAAPMLALRIHGMDCAEEVAVLKRELGPLVGGEERLGFDILNRKMTVAGAAGVSPDAIVAAVRRTGMGAELWSQEQPAGAQRGSWSRYGRTVLTAASGLLLLAGFLTHAAIAGSLASALGSEGRIFVIPIEETVKIRTGERWSASVGHGRPNDEETTKS